MWRVVGSNIVRALNFFFFFWQKLVSSLLVNPSVTICQFYNILPSWRRNPPLLLAAIFIIILVIYLMNTLVKSFEIWHIDTTCHKYRPNTDWPTSDNRGRHRPRPNVHFSKWWHFHPIAPILLKLVVHASFFTRNKKASRTHKVHHDGFSCTVIIWENLQNPSSLKPKFKLTWNFVQICIIDVFKNVT